MRESTHMLATAAEMPPRGNAVNPYTGSDDSSGITSMAHHLPSQ